MVNGTNRWVTTSILLGFFAIIALAGGHQAVSNTTNVLVTNNASQAVPVKITSTTGPVNVNVSTHGKDGLMLHQTLTYPGGNIGATATFGAIPGERFVVTNVLVLDRNLNSEYLTGGDVTVTYKASGNTLFATGAAAQTYTALYNTSVISIPGPIYLDPGENLYVRVTKTGSNTDNIDVTLTGYRVSYP